MSLPTTITFLDNNLQQLATEHYNAGWWVPDVVGKHITALYGVELWTYVIAYSQVYNRDGYPVGKLIDNNISKVTWFDTSTQQRMRDVIDNPPKRVQHKKPTSESINIPMIPGWIQKLVVDGLVAVQPMGATNGQVFQIQQHVGDGVPKKHTLPCNE